MTDVITAIQTAIGITNKLRELSKKVQDAEFKMLLADLSNELADAKLEVASLKDEIANLKEEQRKHKEQLETKNRNKPTVSNGAYTFEDDASRHYCTACFDARNQKILLTALKPPFTTFGKWKCPACEAIMG